MNGEKRGVRRATRIMLLLALVALALPLMGCGLTDWLIESERTQQAQAQAASAQAQVPIAQAGSQATSAQAYSHAEAVISENNKTSLLALYAYLATTGDVAGTASAAGFSWGSALIGAIAGALGMFGLLWCLAQRNGG